MTVRIGGGIQQFGDAEIEDLRPAGGIHQNVRRLEIAVDNQAPVGVGHAFADLEKELQAAAHVKLGRVDIDGNAFDVFHHQERPSFGGVAGIDHVDDGGVLQGGEQLALGEKAIAPHGAVAIGVKQFYRHALLNLTIGALGEIDAAHASASDQGHDAVSAEGIAGAGSLTWRRDEATPCTASSK